MNSNRIDLDILIIGAGFAGMYMLYRMKKLNLKVLAIESASDVGGTWYWNRYPGARCDVESVEYSYSFSEELQQDWQWTHRFSDQPEILKYANHVADRFELRPDIKFDTKVISANYNSESKLWEVVTDKGDLYFSRFCIMATGTLSAPNDPDFDGLDNFEGEWYMTSKWPHQPPDFTGKRVGIIGTGSTGIQTIPVVAEEAKHLTVFQRTAQFTIPANNRKLNFDEVEEVKRNYSEIRKKARESRGGIAFMDIGDKSALEVSDQERYEKFSSIWNGPGLNDFVASYNDIVTNIEANELAGDFLKSKIREIVEDDQIAEKLIPEILFWCKRVCADTNYYETYNKENVELVDVSSSPIDKILPEGIEVSNKVYDLDVIIFAIGFDALTGALNAIDIVGKDGVKLKEKWADGPITYLGLAVNGFPNLFTITGPGSPSVLSNMMTSIEQHVDWISNFIEYSFDKGLKEIEASSTAEIEWTSHVEELGENSLKSNSGCNSWYLGSNVPGKKRVFMPYIGGVGKYREECDAIVSTGYKGFLLN